MTKGTGIMETEMLFRNHYREFCLLSYSYVSCMDRAEDIVQDVFLVILTRKDPSQIIDLKAYIWRSVKNASLKSLERTRKMEPIMNDILAPVHTENEIEDRQLSQKLQQAMDKLPLQCKNVFKICAIDGQKYDYAADHLGISKNTVKTQMKKAYRILRSSLVIVVLMYSG